MAKVKNKKGRKKKSHKTSAADFEEWRIQDACDDGCSICLEAFCDTNPSTVTSCRHDFHLQCILEWFQKSSTCPMCSQPISLKDPSSQELLEAVALERSISQSTLPNRERAGLRDEASKCKEAISRGRRGWIERLLSGNDSMTGLGSDVKGEVNAGIQIGDKRPLEAEQAWGNKRQRTLKPPPLSGDSPLADRKRLIMASDDLVASQVLKYSAMASHWATEVVRRSEQSNTKIESLEADLIRANSEVNTMVLSEEYLEKKLDDAEANLKSCFERIGALEETIASKDKEIQSFERKRQELVDSCVRQLEEARKKFFLEGWDAAMDRAKVPPPSPRC